MARSAHYGFTGNEVATSVDHRDSGVTEVWYHKTLVASSGALHIDPQGNRYRWVVLNHGGWPTATTTRRMNQLAGEQALRYHVWRRKGQMFVTLDLPGGRQSEFEIPFGGRIFRALDRTTTLEEH